jgi:cytochrome c peroxidase
MRLAAVFNGVVLLSLAGMSVGQGSPPSHAEQAGHSYPLLIPLGLIEPDVPLNDPLTVEKVDLGKRLFFETRLSASGKMSCATCHDPQRAFSEAKPISTNAIGLAMRRNAPSILNSGFLPTFGWDGKFRSLEQQALDPFHTWSDMGLDIDAALDKLDTDPAYRRMFAAAFGSEISTSTFARAIAAYERSLVSGDSRFDRYLFGGESTALTEMEKEGFDIFINQANCLNCHDVFHPVTNPLGARIATFTDHRFHNLGVGYNGNSMQDTGRYEITRDPGDWGAFKTPSLRNVALTAPYMHDGSLATLEEVVAFYNRGGTANPNLAPGMKPLYLTPHQREALVAFLRTLTSQNPH